MEDLNGPYVPTPAAQALLRLHRAGRSAEFYAHLDEFWLELWYAFEPGDLRGLVEMHAPPPRIGPSAALLVALTGPQ